MAYVPPWKLVLALPLGFTFIDAYRCCCITATREKNRARASSSLERSRCDFTRFIGSASSLFCFGSTILYRDAEGFGAFSEHDGYDGLLSDRLQLNGKKRTVRVTASDRPPRRTYSNGVPTLLSEKSTAPLIPPFRALVQSDSDNVPEDQYE
ncbi:hypothetical protein JVT61DRAFT_5180 [Boletus reticuloceps]|uniref:Secreted protein n=1 Tax=Boletus reticuloceps TaxID=495285 RepID=A0A8I3AFT3_9AGAM|nr:hypothetical protein JVT61DRAFT_5180 [Boletus reticuloceps]